ncbi:protein kinase domain-containing protein [Enterovirga rhinocerotis]|uniref:Protein kinase-like protein n=1 Tax=Enterovirga rhinocerotis TaxID=1339210 RepID=A0A4V6PZN1_9HYPH|nr:serine/threonine protein kinase [Enterovirga rhinocerotis]TDR93959.1 protein kinase-like protein [Enterovirga rhinocerotis]
MLRLFGAGSGDLSLGQECRLRNAGTVGIVGRKLGAGGQGAVYIVDVGGRELALKWYHPHVVDIDTTLRSRIERLVQEGPPDNRFLFPFDLVTVEGRREFGYVMPVVSSDRRPFRDILAPAPKRLDLGLEARATACYEIADSFQQLHTRGLCYQDINFGSFFIDPIRGGILICDADNITVEGLQGGVLGTPKFMAPEIVRRETIPSSRTDLYSMAVLFFYALFQWHPLEGMRDAAGGQKTPDEVMRLYGRDPLFIFDPRSSDNAPVPGAHDWVVARWKAMPASLRDLFTRSFTDGLWNPDARVVETEWRAAMARLRDAVTHCPTCTFEIPLDMSASEAQPRCPVCATAVPRPTRMTLGRYLVAMQADRRLFAHHVEPTAPIAMRDSVAAVDKHPTDESILGLRNLTQAPWRGRTSGGQPVTIVPGRTVRIIDGLGIDFGRREGVVAGADPSARSAA